MFKGFLFLSVFFCLVSQSFGWKTDSLINYDATKVYNYSLVKAAIPTLDTIGGTDSVVVLAKPFVPGDGSAYIVKFPTITGEGSDSVLYYLITRAFNTAGTLLSSVTDTIKVATTVDILLPINRVGIIGSTYSVTLKGVSPKNGGEHVFTGLWVYRVKATKQ